MIHSLESETKDLKGLKKSLIQQRDMHIKDISSRSGEDLAEEPSEAAEAFFRCSRFMPHLGQSGNP